MKEEIKPNDYVIVIGESNEVFQVDAVEDKAVILSIGVAEPKEKCIKIPKEYHRKIYRVIKDYLDPDITHKLLKGKL